MPDSEEINRRFAELENQIRDERMAVQPILDLYNASKLIGKILVVIGGLTVGAITVWTALADWIWRHWK